MARSERGGTSKLIDSKRREKRMVIDTRRCSGSAGDKEDTAGQ